jgi:hypothetical protein
MIDSVYGTSALYDSDGTLSETGEKWASVAPLYDSNEEYQAL